MVWYVWGGRRRKPSRHSRRSPPASGGSVVHGPGPPRIAPGALARARACQHPALDVRWWWRPHRRESRAVVTCAARPRDSADAAIAVALRPVADAALPSETPVFARAGSPTSVGRGVADAAVSSHAGRPGRAGSAPDTPSTGSDSPPRSVSHTGTAPGPAVGTPTAARAPDAWPRPDRSWLRRHPTPPFSSLSSHVHRPIPARAPSFFAVATGSGPTRALPPAAMGAGTLSTTRTPAATSHDRGRGGESYDSRM